MDKCCNNCGHKGHVYKDCCYPILSYGIILYDDTDIKNIKIVMIEKKNTIVYVEFLRGKYDCYNNDYMMLLFERMHDEEKETIKNNEFDTLWEKLWVDTSTLSIRIKREYQESKLKYNFLKAKNYLEFLADNSSNKYTENEWEIPKGRRNIGENNNACAIREFKEETNIDPSKYTFIKNVVPLIEEYIGINNVNYRHVYYIAKIKTYEGLYVDVNNQNQVNEVKNIKWLNKEDCIKKIRWYYSSRLKVINSFFKLLDNTDDIYIE